MSLVVVARSEVTGVVDVSAAVDGVDELLGKVELEGDWVEPLIEGCWVVLGVVVGGTVSLAVWA